MDLTALFREVKEHYSGLLDCVEEEGAKLSVFNRARLAHALTFFAGVMRESAIRDADLAMEKGVLQEKENGIVFQKKGASVAIDVKQVEAAYSPESIEGKAIYRLQVDGTKAKALLPYEEHPGLYTVRRGSTSITIPKEEKLS